MRAQRRSALVPIIAAGLLGVSLAGCAAYGTGGYGYYGRPHSGYDGAAVYGHGRVTPYSHNWDRRGLGYDPPYGQHNGFGYGHRGGRFR